MRCLWVYIEIEFGTSFDVSICYNDKTVYHFKFKRCLNCLRITQSLPLKFPPIMKTSFMFSLISGYALIANAMLVNGPMHTIEIWFGCFTKTNKNGIKLQYLNNLRHLLPSPDPELFQLLSFVELTHLNQLDNEISKIQHH